MGNERKVVSTAFLSDDERSVEAFDEHGKKIVTINGANFENVWLENDNGEIVEFEKKPNSRSEIEELKKQIEALSEALKNKS